MQQHAMKVYVRNGDKEFNIELDHIDEYQKLFLLHNVMSVFGIDTDMLESYKQIEKIYKLFYKEMSLARENEESVKEIDQVQFSREGFKEIAVEQEATHEHNNKYLVAERLDPKVGIKEIDHTPHYQLFYSCDNQLCRDKRTHKAKTFVPLNTERIKCQSCYNELEVKPAHPEGFPGRDNFGNYFVAGYFRDRELDWPNDEN